VASVQTRRTGGRIVAGLWRGCSRRGRAVQCLVMPILTVPLSEAKENRQDLRWHRGDLAATTVRFAQPPFHAQLKGGLTGDAARFATLTGSIGLQGTPSVARENRQDLRWHRGDLAATTVRFGQPPFHAQLKGGLTGDAARFATLTGSIGLQGTLSEAKENRQDLRWHRGDFAATTVRFRATAIPCATAERHHRRCCLLAALTGSIGLQGTLRSLAA
jgi:hypothetical protein